MLPLARAALRRPALTLLLFLLGTAVMTAGLFRLEIRTDGSSLYPRGDPTVRRTLRDRVMLRIADLPARTFLVLDDVHALRAQPVLDDLELLLLSRPDRLGVILISRTAPAVFPCSKSSVPNSWCAGLSIG